MRATAVPLLDGSRGVAVTYHDVTQQHHLGEALRQAALHDPLTGLANRRLLSLRFRHSRATAQRTGTRLGLAYIDLDRFRLVNDLLGHLAGDRLLRQVGERLAAVTREADTIAASVGWAMVDRDTDLDAALHRADSAMELEKARRNVS